MNLQISGNSKLNTQIVPTAWPLFDRKFCSAAVLLYKLDALRVTRIVSRGATKQ